MASRKESRTENIQQKQKIESLENEIKILKSAVVRVLDDFVKIAKISNTPLPAYLTEHKTTSMLVSFMDILAKQLKHFQMLEAKIKQLEEKLGEASRTNNDILTMQEYLEDEVLEIVALNSFCDMRTRIRQLIKDFEIRPKDPPVSRYKQLKEKKLRDKLPLKKCNKITLKKDNNKTAENELQDVLEVETSLESEGDEEEADEKEKIIEKNVKTKLTENAMNAQLTENKVELTEKTIMDRFTENTSKVTENAIEEESKENTVKAEITETDCWLSEVGPNHMFDDDDTQDYDTPMVEDKLDLSLDVKQLGLNVNLEIQEDTRDKEGENQDSIEVDKPTNDVGKNTCKWCRKVFKKPSLLKYHIRIHTGEKPFKCTVCSVAFAQRPRLKMHMRTHTGERPYKCLTCGKAFCRQGDFRIHKRIHNKDDQFKCESCDASFTRRKYLRIHNRIHTGQKPFMCQQCGKAFMRSGSLKIHMKYIHKDNYDENQIHKNRLKVRCNICDKLMNKSGMKKHMATHTGEKPYTCHLCGTSFVQKGNLDYHIKWHANEKAFKCQFCEKSFIRNGDLNHHMKSHRTDGSGKKQPIFMCDICGKCLSGRLILESHISMHSGEKNHSCDMCDKKFFSSKSLMEHQRHTHKKKKTHQCDFCGKVLAHNGSLKSHRMTHTGEKPFECKECGARFRKSGTLQGHMVIHTGETPFKCDHCGERFRHRQQLYWHKDKCTLDKNENNMAIGFL